VTLREQAVTAEQLRWRIQVAENAERHPNFNAVSPDELATVEAARAARERRNGNGPEPSYPLDIEPEHAERIDRADGTQTTDEPEFEIVGRLASEIYATVPGEINWLVPGVAAPGWMVKFAAREKTGKGKLVAYLLARMERNESTLFGPAFGEPVTALVYTEEDETSYREKIDHAGLRLARIIHEWELPKHIATWRQKVDYLVRVAVEEGHGIVYVDNISRAAGVDDEAGVELARAGELLSTATKAAGLSAWIDHHHKKGHDKLENKSRGGTALAGACENNIEMEQTGPWDSRVRKLSSRGRVGATRWQRSIALSADSTDYEEVAGKHEPTTAKARARLKQLSECRDGATAEEYGALIGVERVTANNTLKEFEREGWAEVDESTSPWTWKATGKGLPSPNAPTTAGDGIDF
jgi:hypothetical protein